MALYLLTLKNLKTRPLRSFLTALGIILGVAIIWATSIANNSTNRAFTSVIEEIAGRTDLWVMSTGGQGLGLPGSQVFSEDYARKIKRLDVVEETSPVYSAPTGLKVTGEDKALRFSIMGIDPVLGSKMRNLEITSGRFFKPGRKEILLMDAFAEEHDIRLGDEVRIDTPSGDRALIVTGLLESTGASSMQGGGGTGFSSLRTIQNFYERSSITLLEIKLREGISLERGEREVEAELTSPLKVELPSQQVEQLEEMLAGIQYGFSFFSAVAIFVGMFLIYNSFAMSVVERTRELGILRSLGATRRQVFSALMIEAVTLGILATMGGLALGLGLAKGLTFMLAQAFDTEIGATVMTVDGLITASVVGMVVSLAGAMLPAVRASRSSPLQAVKAEFDHREGWFSRYSWIIGLAVIITGIALQNATLADPDIQSGLRSLGDFTILLGVVLMIPVVVKPLGKTYRFLLMHFTVTGRLSADSLGRSKNRTAITLGVLLISLAMLISMGAINQSISRSVNNWTETAIGADMSIWAGGETYLIKFDRSFNSRLKRIPGVKEITGLSYSQTDWNENALFIQGIEPQTYRDISSLDLTEGEEDDVYRALEKGGAVVLSSVMMKAEKLKVGEEFEIDTALGIREFEIVGSVVDWNSFGYSAFFSRSDMKRYFGIDEDSVFYVNVEPGFDPAEVRDDIKDRLGKRYTFETFTNEELSELIDQELNQFFAIFQAIMGIALIVSLLGIVNTLAMNVLERVREIGVLRAIGTTRTQIRRLIVIESLLIGISSFLLAIPTGWHLSRASVEGMKSATGFNVEYVFPYSWFAIALILATLISGVAALYPAFKAARVRVITAIKYE